MKTQLTVRTESGEKIVFNSLIEEDSIYESRAKDLANIIAYDKEHYSDVNISTILRAAFLAEIIETKGE